MRANVTCLFKHEQSNYTTDSPFQNILSELRIVNLSAKPNGVAGKVVQPHFTRSSISFQWRSLHCLIFHLFLSDHINPLNRDLGYNNLQFIDPPPTRQTISSFGPHYFLKNSTNPPVDLKSNRSPVKVHKASSNYFLFIQNHV